MVLYPIRRFFEIVRTTRRRAHYGYYSRRVRETIANRRRLAQVRRERASRPQNPTPLVSVVIATYNKAELLTQRSIPSALAQTYPNIEVVVVGDACQDDTEKRVAEMAEPRVRFLNLAQRGNYPSNPMDRWCVAGVTPMNKAIELARGEWVAYLDDDDEFSPDHVEVLLKAAQEHDAEMVYGVATMEDGQGSWGLIGGPKLFRGNLTRMAMMARKDISFIENDIESWKWEEPADWDLVRRMRDAGVRIRFVDHVVGKHYAERKRWGS